MRSRYRRIAVAASLIGGSGFLLAGPSTGCISYAGDSLLEATNFCFIFDCQNGILGGTIDPCAGDNPRFADCPTGE